MRRIVLMTSVSLDGFFEGPGGSLDWHLVDDEVHTEFNQVLGAMSAFLDGRVEIVVRDYGRWRSDGTPPKDEGHGLLLMSTLAAVTLTSGPFGTTVTLRRLRL